MRSLLAAAVLTVALASGWLASTAGNAYGPLVSWNGGDWFLLGTNYPWLNYGHDFGCNAWGCDGASTGGAYDANFADMNGKGVHVARWFVFADLRAGVTFAPDGTPTGVQQQVYDDLDRALEIAAAHNVYLDLVLFDFYLLKPAQIVSGVQLFGRSDLMTDPAKRAALLDNVVAPVLTRYKNQPYILAWEVMNEPEWVISDLPEPDPQTPYPMTMAHFWDFTAGVSSLVRNLTNAYVTMGSASLKWHRVWTNAFADAHGLPRPDLTLYQTHYYSWMDGWEWVNHPDLGTTKFSALEQSYAALGLDQPMVVAEFDAPSGQATALLDTIAANGYAGAWPWAYPNVDWAGFSSWEAVHASDVRIPPAGVIPTPQPPTASVGGSTELASTSNRLAPGRLRSQELTVALAAFAGLAGLIACGVAMARRRASNG